MFLCAKPTQIIYLIISMAAAGACSKASGLPGTKQMEINKMSFDLPSPEFPNQTSHGIGGTPNMGVYCDSPDCKCLKKLTTLGQVSEDRSTTSGNIDPQSRCRSRGMLDARFQQTC